MTHHLVILLIVSFIIVSLYAIVGVCGYYLDYRRDKEQKKRMKIVEKEWYGNNIIDYSEDEK